MDYRAPGFRQPQQFNGSLDGLFEQYQAMKNQQAQEGRQDFADTVQFGTPIRGMTPEQLQRGAQGPFQPSGPTQNGQPMAPQFDNDPHVAAIQRFIQTKKQGASMASQEQQLGMDKTRAGIASDQSQVRLNDAKAEKERADAKNGPASERIPKQNEFAARNYADMATQAEANLEKLLAGDPLKGVAAYSPTDKISTQGDYVPNIVKSGGTQQYEQIERQFVQAVLRKESGASISPEEMSTNRKKYFAKPGDGPEVVAQKKAARALAVQGLAAEGARVSSNVSKGGDPLGLF